jgi:hypothetical protein
MALQIFKKGPSGLGESDLFNFGGPPVAAEVGPYCGVEAVGVTRSRCL